MKNSRRARALALAQSPKAPVPPVSRYAVKTLGAEAAKAAHAAIYGPTPKAKGGVVKGA